MLALFLTGSYQQIVAQTIDIKKEAEVSEFKERNQAKQFSYLIFPVTDDSLAAYNSKSFKRTSNKNIQAGIFSPETAIQYNSTVPYGWNDGPMIPNRGFQSYSTVGIYLKMKFISIQFRPEIVFAQNKSFAGFPQSYDDKLWANRYFWYNQVDNPERFTKHVQQFYPGQSNIKLHFRSVSAGISTENLWWGPGKNNSLLMSNNAPGFAHIFIKTEKPLVTKIGRFEFQLIAGNLTGSGEIPPDTGRMNNGQRIYQEKPADGKRYLNGLIVVYQPSFLKGFSAGLGRIFYLYESDRKNSIDGFLPIFGFLLKSQAGDEDNKRRDQMLSLYLKQSFDKGASNVYLEFARNDHAADLRDLFTDPFHSRAFILGINKSYKLKRRKLNFNFEMTELSRSSKANPRATPYWYVHYQVVHGYTNRGQIIGAGIGTGGAMQSVQIDLLNNNNSVSGFGIYRIERNKDFFYDSFVSTGEYYRKWVDLVAGFKYNRSFKHFNLLSNLYLIHAFNYQWQDVGLFERNIIKNGADVLNASVNVTLQYRW